MKNVGYARVSTSGQSLEIQLENLKDCDIIFQEKVSGKNLDRPELTKLMHYIRKDDVVHVTKLDRLARSTKDLLEIVQDIDKRQVALKIHNLNLDTSTPTGRLMITMLGAIAEFEREMILERQSEGIVRAKQEGKYKGRKPTAMLKAGEVLNLAKNGVRRTDIASQQGISLKSVHRIMKGFTNVCV